MVRQRQPTDEERLAPLSTQERLQYLERMAQGDSIISGERALIRWLLAEYRRLLGTQ